MANDSEFISHSNKKHNTFIQYCHYSKIISLIHKFRFRKEEQTVMDRHNEC